MGNPKAFLTIPRQEAGYRPVHDRINDFGEVEQTLNTSERKQQPDYPLRQNSLQSTTRVAKPS